MLVTKADSKAYDAVLKVTGHDSIEELDMGDFFKSSSKDQDDDSRRSRKSGDRKDNDKRDGDKRDTDRKDGDRKQGRKRQRGDDEIKSMSHGDNVVGLGDHVPAFLLRTGL